MYSENKSYKIEVSLTDTENRKKPFYWILWGNDNGVWNNTCCGWAATPEQAWSEGVKFYKSFKQPNHID